MSVKKVHFCHVMLYEFSKGINVSVAIKNIQEVYQDQTPAKRIVEKWFLKFLHGELSVEDEPDSGQLSDIDDDVAHTLVQNTPRISAEEVATALKVDRSTFIQRLKTMGFDLNLDIWVSHFLSESNKIQRISVAISLLGRFKNEPLLDRLATGDEKWVQYNIVHCKISWKQAGE